MNNEKFNVILDNDEEIKWSSGVNIPAYVKKNFCSTFLFGLIPPFAILMLGIPYSWVLLILSLLKVIPIWIGVPHFIISIITCLLYIYILNLQAKNTFFCITNKRIIKRDGAFSNNFVHYSLKNIGTVEIDGSIFDSKEDNPSARLNITVKDYHTNTDGNSTPKKLSIDCLDHAYEAYKMLNNLTEGNNENLRIKIEK